MTTLTTSSRRLLSEAVKKQVAYRQQWKCSVCRELLPPSYQIDHTIPLCDGGADDESNTTAMCPTCHANKTQQEHINRHYHSVSKRSSDGAEVFYGGPVLFTSLRLMFNALLNHRMTSDPRRH